MNPAIRRLNRMSSLSGRQRAAALYRASRALNRDSLTASADPETARELARDDIDEIVASIGDYWPEARVQVNSTESLSLNVHIDGGDFFVFDSDERGPTAIPIHARRRR